MHSKKVIQIAQEYIQYKPCFPPTLASCSPTYRQQLYLISGYSPRIARKSKDTNWKKPGLALSWHMNGPSQRNLEPDRDETLMIMQTVHTQKAFHTLVPHFIDEKIGYFGHVDSWRAELMQGSASQFSILVQCKWPLGLRVLWRIICLK